eukprot:EC794209.1.p1 GENE.EC794209.1~~EC794209.1.p1  ORF type:complete len:153 (+),score=61.72 EC794209.1:47-505(+)
MELPLEQIYRILDLDGHGRITPKTLQTILRRLGKPVTLAQAKEIVWENDSKAREYIDFDSFEYAIRQAVEDDSGTVPHFFLTLADWIEFDREVTGRVSVDELVYIISRRFNIKVAPGDVRSMFANIGTDTATEYISYSDYEEQIQVRRMLIR